MRGYVCLVYIIHRIKLRIMSKRTASRNVRRTGDVLCSSGSPSITEVEAAKLISERPNINPN
ncbi:unnamed protein product [Schistosoma mattheei]|uniref:Uncharacterized protein n=1 Tax=Schistosoma mattheei TaxID=31246 RepID=A0A3P8FP38_9TREM|nr:unnamed protein product [Schistosoma mattheei]